MKVAFVSHPTMEVLEPRNSVEIWTQEVANRLVSVCDVTIYGTGTAFGRQTQTRQGVDYVLLPLFPDHWITKWLYRFKKLAGYLGNKRFHPFSFRFFYCFYSLRVALELRRQRVEIAHIQSFFQFVPILRLLNPQMKIICHFHTGWYLSLDHQTVQQLLSPGDRILTCSDYLTVEARRCYPQLADRCQTLYNGVNLEQFIQSPDPALPVAAAPTPRVVFIGRLSPEKGVHYLVEAFHQVVQQFPQAQLQLIGTEQFLMVDDFQFDPEAYALLAPFYERGPGFSYQAYLEERAIALGIRDNITFSGFVPHSEMAAVCQSATAFAAPSVWHEPFGMVIVEAMAMALPVVVTRVGGIPEIVDSGKTGLLVDRANVDQLATALIELLSDPARARAMGLAGRQQVLNRFSWETVIQSLLSIYRQLRPSVTVPGTATPVPQQ